jgi:hypothetical protein
MSVPGEAAVLEGVVQDDGRKAHLPGFQARGEPVLAHENPCLRESPCDHERLVTAVFPGPEQGRAVREDAPVPLPRAAVPPGDEGRTVPHLDEVGDELHGQGGFFGAAEREIADADRRQWRFLRLQEAALVEDILGPAGEPG